VIFLLIIEKISRYHRKKKMIPRYKNKKISEIWSIDNKLNTWLNVELAHLSALNSNIVDKTINQREYDTVIDNIKIDKDRWKEIESETKHDLQAFVQMLEESIPDNSGRWIHYGLTSSDVLDTSLTLMCRDSLKEIASNCASCIFYINQQINSEKSKTNILARTHGKSAEIQTYKDVFLRWKFLMQRAYDEIIKAQKTVNKGKLSGPTGNYTTNSILNENIALNALGLRSITSSQIIPRDIYLDYFYSILKVMLAVEKISYDIRMYSIDGINEMSESFSNGQKGSSAMPHKKNPVGCENLCGIARLYKSYFQTAIDNCFTLFERDLSNSSPERVIFKDSAHVACYSLERLSNIINRLVVEEENANNNVEKYRSKIDSQNLMNNLIKEGSSRKESHDLAQKNS
jgi:adenylosuccinate lyase